MGWAETKANMDTWQRVAVETLPLVAVYGAVGASLAALLGKSVGAALVGAAAYGVAHYVWRWRRYTRVE
jgi:hypothetical protein